MTEFIFNCDCWNKSHVFSIDKLPIGPIFNGQTVKEDGARYSRIVDTKPRYEIAQRKENFGILLVVHISFISRFLSILFKCFCSFAETTEVTHTRKYFPRPPQAGSPASNNVITFSKGSNKNSF